MDCSYCGSSRCSGCGPRDVCRGCGKKKWIKHNHPTASCSDFCLGRVSTTGSSGSTKYCKKHGTCGHSSAECWSLRYKCMKHGWNKSHDTGGCHNLAPWDARLLGIGRHQQVRQSSGQVSPKTMMAIHSLNLNGEYPVPVVVGLPFAVVADSGEAKWQRKMMGFF